jgi:hypothetical protein
MLQRSHRKFRGIGQNRKHHDAQYDLADEREKCFEHIRLLNGWHRDSRNQILSSDRHRGRNNARQNDTVNEGRLPSPKIEERCYVS